VKSPNLAFAYQEILIVVARLRSRKFALGDSAVFRTQIRKALQQAEHTAQVLGYSQDDIRLSSFAVVSLLDETILNSSNPAFRDWAQKPLMLDLFGTLTAGETCFEHMRAIAKRPESKFATDLLEIYVLCLMLGFRGRYSSGSDDQLRTWRDPMIERILRSRGTTDRVQLSRSWKPAEDVAMPAPSNRMTRLAWSSCVAVFSACALLWAVYHSMLGRAAAELAALTSR
jgi:type VI secretion system protein ImpK